MPRSGVGSHPYLACAPGDLWRNDAMHKLLSLLALSAAVCAWQRRSAWAYVLAACVATAVAAWQTYILLHSMLGHSWDPVFHGIKLGILAVVVCVDLAAVYVLLRSRSRLEAVGQARAGLPAWLHSGFLLLVVAAALSIASLPWLATTGE